MSFCAPECKSHMRLHLHRLHWCMHHDHTEIHFWTPSCMCTLTPKPTIASGNIASGLSSKSIVCVLAVCAKDSRSDTFCIQTYPAPLLLTVGCYVCDPLWLAYGAPIPQLRRTAHGMYKHMQNVTSFYKVNFQTPFSIKIHVDSLSASVIFFSYRSCAIWYTEQILIGAKHELFMAMWKWNAQCVSWEQNGKCFLVAHIFRCTVNHT